MNDSTRQELEYVPLGEWMRDVWTDHPEVFIAAPWSSLYGNWAVLISADGTAPQFFPDSDLGIAAMRAYVNDHFPPGSAA